MGTGTLNLNILKTEAQTDPIIELTDSGANGGVVFSGVTSFNDSATFTSTTTFNDSATFNSIVNFSGSSSLSLQDSSIPVSKLQVPGGTPSSSTFLRGDNQWAAPPAVDKTSVLSATATAGNQIAMASNQNIVNNGRTYNNLNKPQTNNDDYAVYKYGGGMGYGEEDF